jgi:phosphatidylserine/phosphatidylglycerophosphate/cardiolipin synthase-like enzyme
MTEPSDWFLSREERGNPASTVDEGRAAAHTEGNLVRPLVHGAAYFARLCEVVSAMQRGDRLFLTDWRGDADELLMPEGPTVRELLCDAAARGVEVRALLWRSHSDRATFSAQENERLGAQLNEAGAEALLDQRVRRVGSHHQKLVVARHKGRTDDDVAFVGGIDLCHGRRDDDDHAGDPQQQPMDPRYGARAPWHDAMVEVRGPVVCDVLRTFTERWDDPTPLDHRNPYRALMQRAAHMPRHPDRLPEPYDDPPAAGPHAVQVLRTYAAKRPAYPFAPLGERSVARAYIKAFRRARRLIYIEDQYLWSRTVARTLADALRRWPDLRVIAVVPRFPDDDGKVSGPPNRLGQIDAIRRLARAGADRFAVYDIENADGVPIYVHAKVCIVDDTWFTCGSDNFNRRSWTHDSEITCAVVDPQMRLARDLRLGLWSEHLGRDVDDLEHLDPAAGFAAWRETARALDDWHRSGRRGPRPPGRARAHRPQPVGPVTRLWATPVYRLVHDPDGRPWRLRVGDRL